MTVDPAHLRGVDPSRPERPSESDVRYAFDRYLENVAFADSLVGEVLEILDRHGRFDDALVVLTSDHGEAFMEHGLFLHSQNVYRELLHVPLVVKWPRSVTGFRSVVDEPVSLLDLAPTLVDGLSLSGADDGFQGRSLLPLTFDGRRGDRAMYAVRGANSPSHASIPKLMLESGGWRVHVAPLDDRIELYRVAQDPLEKEDLASELPLQALLVRQSLLMQSFWNRELLRSAGADPAGGELDPEATAQLEALGYLP
jgi:arylsulfatase A-like enzyme